MNRNPNCNHNSTHYYNSGMVHVKFDRESTINSEDKARTTDLLWKNGHLYSEQDELSALAAVLYKLFSNPKLGESSGEKKKAKLKTITGKFFCIF